ncbi:MAG TPA: acyl-CoA dehydrogenase family protein [Ktedonobacterales bacterium]|jgi:alkylation response protein AidB-like acyl-CoA dehydrogenase|nr:acyl-CoA dehydrogenase family protein [Ktedonobacterales bacterium]
MITVTQMQATPWCPTPIRPDDDLFVGLAAEVGTQCAPRAAAHDRDNTFVAENYTLLRDAGYTRLAIPKELGGLGATMRQVCYAQAELAKYCGATALAINMHIYVTLVTTYRWRHGAAETAGLLRSVADDGAILMTSGGSDGIWPSAVASRVEGGYRVSGRKVFCSQAPAATTLTTSAVYEDPREGMTVLAILVPMASERVRVIETWDTMGMRGTSSHDTELTEVFVPDQAVITRREWGKVDVSLRNALVHITPTASAVYFGIAAGARDEAVRTVMQRKAGNGEPAVNDPIIQRQIGLMEYRLRTAWWSLVGALDELGDDYALGEREVGLTQIAKRDVLLAAQEVVDTAMETVGGSAYFRRSPLERAYRDVRAGKYHPFNPERVLLYAGRQTLGLPVDGIW